MLILTRKNGEGIQIGENVKIVVKETRKGRATIAIEAPRNIRILRTELDDYLLPTENA